MNSTKYVLSIFLLLLTIHFSLRRKSHILAGVVGFGKPRPKNSPLDYFCLHFVQARPFRILLIKTKTKSHQKMAFHFGWGGRIRTYEMSESESDALPLGDTPI